MDAAPSRLLSWLAADPDLRDEGVVATRVRETGESPGRPTTEIDVIVLPDREGPCQVAVKAFDDAGFNELILYPKVSRLDQIDRLAEVVLWGEARPQVLGSSSTEQYESRTCSLARMHTVW